MLADRKIERCELIVHLWQGKSVSYEHQGGWCRVVELIPRYVLKRVNEDTEHRGIYAYREEALLFVLNVADCEVDGFTPASHCSCSMSSRTPFFGDDP